MKFVRFMRRSVLHLLLSSVVLMELFQSLTVFLQLIPMFVSIKPWVETAFFYAAFLGIWLFIPYMLIFRWNRPILKGLWTRPGIKNISGFGIGVAIGFCLNLVCFWAAYLHGDVSLSFAVFEPGILLVLFICVLIQSGAEELVTRLYLYQKLRYRFGRRWPAILLNALLFGALHLLNPGVSFMPILNIILFGIFETLILIVTDSLWTAIGVHTAWNFCQSIVLGLPNSGQLVPYTVYTLHRARNSFAYNVEFGLEGTILACVVLAVASIVCLVIMIKGNHYDTDLFKEYRALEEAKSAQFENVQVTEEKC